MDVSHRHNGSDFVWDEDKAASNLRRHGVNFVDAATVFDDPLVRTIDASRNDESRTAAVGFDKKGRLLTVVFVVVDEAQLRIISSWRASAREEAQYAE